MNLFLVSGNNLPELPIEGTHIDNFAEDILFSFKNGFTHMVTSLREGVTAIYNVNQSITDVQQKVNLLVNNNTITADGSNYIVLNQFIGNIRFACGDLVFTEIYILLMIGLCFFLFQILGKLMQVIKYLTQSFGRFNIFDRFDGLGALIKGLFQ